MPEGATGMNVARRSAIWAGCPVTTAGTTINRFCSSGLQAIAMAAQQVMTEQTPMAIGSGVESISLVQMGGMNTKHITEEHLMQVKPALWMSMIETAEIVAERYGISRERQDEYALESQRRTAAAQQAGKFADEIVPLTTKMKKVDKATKEGEHCRRRGRPRRMQSPRHDAGRAAGAQTRVPGRHAGQGRQIHHGRQCLAVFRRRLGLRGDGASRRAEKKGLKPLGIFRGFAVAGCEPDEMGIGPVYAIPRLLSRHGLKPDDIDIWELNEAFASQVLYCARQDRHSARQAECRMAGPSPSAIPMA